MKTIESLDAAREKETTFEELSCHRTFFWAYRNSCEADTETLDFDDVIWEQDIPEIIECCRRFGISRFTISCGMSSMAETIWAFEKNGCCLIGMTEVNTRFNDWKTGQHGRKPAFELRVLPA